MSAIDRISKEPRLRIVYLSSENLLEREFLRLKNYNKEFLSKKGFSRQQAKAVYSSYESAFNLEQEVKARLGQNEQCIALNLDSFLIWNENLEAVVSKISQLLRHLGIDDKRCERGVVSEVLDRTLEIKKAKQLYSSIFYSRDNLINEVRHSFFLQSKRPIPYFKLKTISRKSSGKHHRSGWPVVTQELEKISPKEGVLLDSFLEKKFSWGWENGDLNSKYPTHYEENWAGIFHCPPDVPAWALENKKAPEEILELELFKRSLEKCVALFCLSRHHSEWLRQRVDVPVCNLTHPIESSTIDFSYEKFSRNHQKKLLQIGVWLRDLSAIERIQAKNYEKVILPGNLNGFVKNYWNDPHCIAPSVLMRRCKIIENNLDFQRYDRLLSQSIVFAKFNALSASNTICECIARATPILINRLDASEEYLGKEYPFFYESEKEADEFLQNEKLIEETHHYLLERRKLECFTLSHFCDSINDSLSLSRRSTNRTTLVREQI